MIFKFLILAIIIFIKAIFAASDTAFTYLNKYKINQISKHPNKSDKKTRKIKNMLENKLRIFGVTRTGMTLAELFASAFTAEAFVGIVAQKFQILGINVTVQYTISIILVTIVLSYFTLVFGELIPKRIARNNPEKVAYKTINFIVLTSKINYFFEKILNYSENFFSKIFGIKNEPNDVVTEKEIKLIIAEGKEQGIFNDSEKKLLYNALKFDDLKAKDIMIPKDKVVCINVNDTIDKVLEKIKKYKYTRIPVYSKNRENIIGILNVKDILLKNLESDKVSEIDIAKTLRDPIYINKDENIDKIFSNMQLNQKHMAIIKDKEGKFEGMLTLENILESLVGNIIDEFDKN